MTTNYLKDVGDFHEKFGLDNVNDEVFGPKPAIDSHAATQFRIMFLQEELAEFIKGYEEGDPAQMADALVDLVYVALGTAHLFGLPFQELWDDVQAANMRKQRAAADGSDSKRGSSLDVIKPEGWVGPDTEGIMIKHGFKA